MRKVSNPMTGNTTELPYKNPELPAEERIAAPSCTPLPPTCPARSKP